MGSAARRIAVTNVRVFDGRQLLPPGTVVIEGTGSARTRPGPSSSTERAACCCPG